jgi:hypothetical protein
MNTKAKDESKDVNIQEMRNGSDNLDKMREEIHLSIRFLLSQLYSFGQEDLGRSIHHEDDLVEIVRTSEVVWCLGTSSGAFQLTCKDIIGGNELFVSVIAKQSTLPKFENVETVFRSLNALAGGFSRLSSGMKTAFNVCKSAARIQL